ncbi:MAG: helix-turn-helix domain-containing protein [Cetobacterium sp.]|nr:helix-turn-helix domain-containing protein [Cetobacterium sp.]
MKLGEYIKSKRLSRKLSLRQMSYKTGLSHTYISDIEKGNLTGTDETQRKIIEALNLDEKEIEIFYTLMIEQSQVPLYLKEKIEKLEKELEECRHQLNIQNNNNNGHIIVGSGNNIKHSSYTGTELCKELNELDEKQKEKVLKFINEYIK